MNANRSLQFTLHCYRRRNHMDSNLQEMKNEKENPSTSTKRAAKKSALMVNKYAKQMSSPSVVATENHSRMKTSDLLKGRGYRSSFIPFMRLMEDIHHSVTPEHLNMLNKTPFGKIFKIFYDKKLTRKDVLKPTQNIVSIINSYSEEEDGFKLGDKLVKLTIDDVSLTFGLPKKGTNVTPLPKNKLPGKESPFVQRQFEGVKSITKAVIESAVKHIVTINETVAREDFVRLVILYMAVTIFFPTCLGVSSTRLNLIQHIEDFSVMNQTSWAKEVHDQLMSQVRLHHKDPIMASGCVIQLLYWFCEHVDIISPIEGFDGSLPRVAKWSMDKLSKIFPKDSLAKLPNEKVSIELKSISTSEKILLEVESCERRPSKRIQEGENEFASDEMEEINHDVMMGGDEVGKRKGKMMKPSEERENELRNNHDIMIEGNEVGKRKGKLMKPSEERENELQMENTKLKKENLELWDENIILKSRLKTATELDGTRSRESTIETELDRTRSKEGKIETELDGSIKRTRIIWMNEFVKEIQDKTRLMISHHMTRLNISLLNNHGGFSEPSQSENNEMTEVSKEDEQPEDGKKCRREVANYRKGGAIQGEWSIETRSQEKQRRRCFFECEEPTLKRMKKKHEESNEGKVKTSNSLCQDLRKDKQQEKMQHENTVDLQSVSSSDINTEETNWKLYDVTKNIVYGHLLKKERQVVEAFFKHAGRGTVAWHYARTCIYGSHLEDLLFKNYVDGEIIDWYSYYLQNKPKEGTRKSLFFSTWTLPGVEQPVENIEKVCLVDVIKNMDEDVECLFFPINHKHHWTLLYLDYANWDWKHYNSVLPRAKSANDKHICAARRLRTRVIQIINESLKQKNKSPKTENASLKSEECPQQGNSADCAIFVCKFMGYLRCGRELPKHFKDGKAERCRQKWTYKILSDPPRSWCRKRKE